MTAVTPEAIREHLVQSRTGSLARRLATLLLRIRGTAGEGLEVTIARAVDEAFAAIHREMRG